MVSAETVRQLALALPETEEEPHFALHSFRIKKKIYATLNPPEQRATLRLSPDMQDIFSAIGKGAIFRVPNKWGSYGWTNVRLDLVELELLRDALQIAWREVAPAVFRKKYPAQYLDE